MTTFSGHVGYCIDFYGTTYRQFNATILLSDITGRESRIGNVSTIANNKSNILGAILAGYPNNATGLQQKHYKLSQTEYNQATQEVIWYFSNGFKPDVNYGKAEPDARNDSQAFKNYYNDLLAAAQKVDTSKYDATVLYSGSGESPLDKSEFSGYIDGTAVPIHRVGCRRTMAGEHYGFDFQGKSGELHSADVHAALEL